MICGNCKVAGATLAEVRACFAGTPHAGLVAKVKTTFPGAVEVRDEAPGWGGPAEWTTLCPGCGKRHPGETELALHACKGRVPVANGWGGTTTVKVDDPRAVAQHGPPPAAAPAPRANKFEGYCTKCKGFVAAGSGLLLGERGGYWLEHKAGECVAEPKHEPTMALPDVPEGKYAVVTDEDGHVAFYQIDRPDTGKWAGFTFASLLTGAPGGWNQQRLSKAHTASLLRKIADGPDGAEGAARLFGHKWRTCGYCGAPLSKVQSRAAGYGAKCADNHGYHYPTKAEAMALVAEGKFDLDGVEDLDEEASWIG